MTPDLVVAGAIGLSAVRLDGDTVYWTEARPAEAGRQVIVRCTADGCVTDVTPAPLNARTRVHEYGGGHYAVVAGTVYFANFADQRLWRQDAGKDPRPITPARALRYADAIIDLAHSRLICVREDHGTEGQEPVNTLASVRLDGDAEGGQVLVSGHSFYSNPRLSPDGAQLAWLCWNHPNMPWDGTELWVAAVHPDGTLAPPRKVAGGPAEAIFQPEWSPDGALCFVSDRTGWWNLYRCWPAGTGPGVKDRVDALTAIPAEFGRPQWGLGMSTYAFATARQILCSFVRNGLWKLARLDTQTKELRPFDLPYTEFSDVAAGAGQAFCVAASPTETAAVIRVDLATGRATVLRRSGELTVAPGDISIPQPIEFPTAAGLTAHGFYYRPANRDHAAPADERPPLLVLSHGGPTGAASTALRLALQYWTSRGFAVLDVNYGGSTGYGRAYRERLNGRWGIVDIDDCVNGAAWLVARGLADGRRLAIRGGSAGGYTALSALTFRTLFRAGASYYGISDLEALARDTHKFESRYLDRLVGPYPERRDLYVARSPIHFTDRLATPMILFQGLDDKVVPPTQSERMFAAVKAKGLPVAYLAFEGEQHGFRRAENMKRAMEAELYFYSRIFHFALADPIERVAIANSAAPE